MVRFYRKFFRHQYPGILMWLVVLGVWQRFFFVAIYLTFQRLLSGEESASQATSSRQVRDHGAEVQLSRQMRETGESEAAHVGVIGASSMVGKALLPMLVNTGRMVHAFSRQPHAEEKGVVWHCLSAPPAEASSPEWPRIEEWICLAPIKVLMEHLDFLEACGARRIVALSSTSRFTKVTSSDPAEQALVRHLIDSEERLAKWAEARGIEWVVLRPTLVYGFGMDRNVSVIARFIRRFGFFPVLGAARGLRQPVHAGDVASACFAALQRAEAANHAYNISGAEVLSYREMVERLFSSLGRPPRFVAIPLWAFALAVKLLKVLPRFRHWSPAMAERMNQDMAFGHEEAARDLGYVPRPFVPDERDMPIIRR
jgi:nucleoside-diphosphate-sugar epimerase